MKKKDDILQKEVSEAIKWEPLLHSNEIDIRARSGIVTLGGTVDNYAQKREAAEAVKNVSGVKKIMDEIKVDLFFSAVKSDKEIAALVNQTLKDNWAVPSYSIKVTVQQGWVTLEGILHWNFQRKAADNAIRYLKGIRGVIDKIKIEPEIKSELNQELIEKALRRSWLLEIDNIKVKVDGKTIFLTGTVESLFEKEEAERIAWNTPGVGYVSNELLVELD
jgi:osmotically-inducible protein OsmY